MDNSILITGLIPIIAFVIIDSFSSTKVALWSALILSILEVAYTLFIFKSLDFISVIVFILIAVSVFASLKTKNVKFFLYQPIAVNIVFIIILLGSYFFYEPILKSMAIKYQHILPEQSRQQLASPVFLQVLSDTTLYFGLLLIPQGILVWIFAKKERKWAWLITRGIGFYLVMFLAMLMAMMKLQR